MNADQSDLKGIEEPLLKICVAGSGNLKRSMIRSFAQGRFSTDYYDIQGFDITTRRIRVNDQFIKLIIVDLNPSEFFRKSRPSSYRGASALLIAFEKSSRYSFEAVKYWLEDFREYIPSSKPIGLVGLLTSIENVTSDQGQELVVELGASYHETAVDDLKHIEHIFHDLTLAALRKKRERR
ncbi:MAG: hypothetical protein ACW991_09460 [Candidatus Hodarchaeales archaeon]